MNYQQLLIHHPRLTRSFKKFILEQEATLDILSFEKFIESLHEGLIDARIVLQKVDPGIPRARKLHQLVDQEIEQAQNLKASCQKGCSACCHVEVEITSYETEILAQLIIQGHDVDQLRWSEQCARSVGDPVWKKGSHNLQNKCLFLNQSGECSIYYDRPVMCRRHSVTSPAKLCQTLDAPISLRYFPRVDLLISAANEDEGLEIGPLAKMLMTKMQIKT